MIYIVWYILELLVIFIVFMLMCLLDMYIVYVTVRLYSDFICGAYYDVKVTA